ncbi:hypothetical protein [Aquimarina sp. MMG016]|uniref:hypothetical protein n=1 Tax=Aquimarina sp. MMG016 TaxID=2822690 RepID=UPI001B3A4066|nr:hypothetical protein [Aquimarina sp. MMG016]MBQ4819634.1 hypothetical protein [Aquimarina sp. MMG016]
MREVFTLIKGYEFGTDVIILEKRKLENYKEENEIPYYTQTIIKRDDNTISRINCEFMFDGGVTTIKLKQQGNDVILRVEYST